MKQLLFIRHAETDMAGSFCGSSDPPINERGAQQIDALLSKLQPLPIDAIIASNLQRASMTASAIARQRQLPIESTSALQEIHFGDWEGLTWKQIEQRDAVHAQRWLDEYPALPAPGGESFIAFEERVLRCVDELLLPHHGECKAVVTHAGVIRVVLERLCGHTQEEAWEATANYCCTFPYFAALLT